MDRDEIVARFHQLSKQFDELHQPGAALEVKEDLQLGSGKFNDRLTIDEIQELNHVIEKRLSQLR